MTPQISDVWAQARAFWVEASAPTRAALAGGAAFLILLAIGLTFWASTPDFVAVYAGTPSEAQRLAKELDKGGLPYRISDDGGSLSVRRLDAGRARQVASGIALATTGEQGLRGLDGQGPFATFEQQRIRIERAQEEAIETVLAQYSGVQKASVNLALPAESMLVGEDTPPKAAVTLTPTPGTALDENEIAAIAHVVAGSIPKLTPENVTIASSAGATLWSGGDGAGAGGASGALKARAAAEKEFIRTHQSGLQANLDRLFGPHRALVHLDATLDLDKQETKASRFVAGGDGGTGLLRSQAAVTKDYKGGSAAGIGAGGVTGTDANIPGYAAAQATASGPNGELYKTTEETTEYDNGTENVHTIKTVGEAKRLNVSVWVDDKLPENVRASVERWVRGAVVNPLNAATTQVTVVSAPFDRTAETAALAARRTAEQQALLSAWAPYIVLPLCVGVLLIAGWLLTRSNRRSGVAAPALAGPNNAALGSGIDTLLAGGSAHDLLADAPATTAAVSGDEAAAAITQIKDKLEPELQTVLDFISQRPETAALLLRTWTSDEARGNSNNAVIPVAGQTAE